jgi:exodeoxyribonuclease VII small subunit
MVATMANEQTVSGTGEAQLSYEQAREELVAIVTRLETGGTTLEESLALWERGEELAALCERYLDNARARLDAAAKRADT